MRLTRAFAPPVRVSGYQPAAHDRLHEVRPGSKPGLFVYSFHNPRRIIGSEMDKSPDNAKRKTFFEGSWPAGSGKPVRTGRNGIPRRAGGTQVRM